MTAAFGLVLGVVAKVQERIESLGRLHPDAAANTAVTARRPAARNEFFPPKGGHAVAAIARLYPDLYSVEEHELGLIVGFGFWISKQCRSPRVSKGATSNLRVTPLLTRGILQPRFSAKNKSVV